MEGKGLKGRHPCFLAILYLLPFWLLAANLAQAQTLEAMNSPESAQQEFLRMYYGVSESCLRCHGDYKFFEAVGVERKYYYVDRDAFARSVHYKLGCLGCHGPMRNGVHAKEEKKKAGEEEEALRELIRLRLCSGCHREQAEDYMRSVHGVAALEYRVEEAPLCVDCHGNHYVLPKDDPQSHTNPANVPILCAKCHGSTEIYAKYGLNPNVVASYSESFHGKKEALGYKPVPVCVSCHGIHLIYASDDPRSRVNDANISKTCGECHPGATKSFKAAFSHKRVTPLQKAVLFYVEQFYLWFIFIVIGGMLLVILLNLFFHFRRMVAE